MSTHDSGGDIAVHFSVRPSVTFWLKFGYISLTINGIAFIFYIQLPKDLNNTCPMFCEQNIFCNGHLIVFRLNFFFKFWVVEAFDLSASNLEMFYWSAIKLCKHILYHIFYSIPTIFCENIFYQNCNL